MTPSTPSTPSPTSTIPTLSTARWGKQWRTARLADRDGFFAMVAIDQRPPIFQLLAKARGIEPGQVAFADVARVKRLLAEGLVDGASALLLDPNFGYPACAAVLRPDRGLVVTLEEHRFGETPEGRLSASIEHWSVAKIARLGGDAVKVLAWYRPDASDSVREAQERYVEGVGQECAAAGLPFVLELLVYPFPRGPASLRDYVEDPGKLPALVIDSVRTFAAPRFGVDLFKLESPVPMRDLPDADGADAAATQRWFDRMGEACAGVPWVMLSAGAPIRTFEHTVRYACRAGASGFLAGRAVWADAAARFPDEAAMLAELRGNARAGLARLTEIVHREGRPWQPGCDFSSIMAEGEFAAID